MKAMNTGPAARTAWFEPQVLVLTRSRTLDELLDLSVPQFPHL